MKKIAVLGSRKWPTTQDVALKVNDLYNLHGQFILVSGFADGPSKMAEATAKEFGMPVLSFRPVKISGGQTEEDVWGVDEWRMYRGSGEIIHHHVPTWSDWASAAGFRSMLIAERVSEGVAFWDGHSHGTAHEIELFAAAGKPLEVIQVG